MPCLNEAETVGICIQKAYSYLSSAAISGEVLIADNGSTDGSPEIAKDNGARVVIIKERGYGAALMGGIDSAYGKYVVMADADSSYDFYDLGPFINCLSHGADLVIGNRFKGGIDSGAMPFLHQFLGNPVLSWIGRLFFRLKIGDFHCGLRAFQKDRILALNLRTTGMEFASEMIVKAALAGYRIDEVPTRLYRDGRSRGSHLRTWRDGWRHLSFLLSFSPKWLFLYPGLVLLASGLFGVILLLPGPFFFGKVGFDIHTFVMACLSMVVGVQAISFSVLARDFSARFNIIPVSLHSSRVIRKLSVENILLFSLVLVVFGFVGIGWCMFQWASVDFGQLLYYQLLRMLILSMTGIVIGLQIALSGFMLSVIRIPVK
jgi:glycosyltransferase involved in cell wall biosynthesis